MLRITSPQTPPNLDAIFSALSDPTRRGILKTLSSGEATVMELTAPFEMSQPAISKHLKVLERAGLIERAIDKQRRPAKLRAQPMLQAVEYLQEFKAFWEGGFDALDSLLIEMQNPQNERERHD